MLKIWISRQNPKKLLMGMAGPIFELNPSNLVSNHIFHSCKSAEILVRKSQVVLNLAKSACQSVLSISLDVLDLGKYIFSCWPSSRNQFWQIFLFSLSHFVFVEVVDDGFSSSGYL